MAVQEEPIVSPRKYVMEAMVFAARLDTFEVFQEQIRTFELPLNQTTTLPKAPVMIHTRPSIQLEFRGRAKGLSFSTNRLPGLGLAVLAYPPLIFSRHLTMATKFVLISWM